MYFDKELFQTNATLQDIRLLTARQVDEVNGEKVVYTDGRLVFEKDVKLHSLFELKEEWCSDAVQNQLF